MEVAEGNNRRSAPGDGVSLTLEFLDATGDVLLPGRLMSLDAPEPVRREIPIPPGAASVALISVPASWRP